MRIRITSSVFLLLLLASFAMAQTTNGVEVKSKTNMGCLVFAYTAAQDVHAQKQLKLNNEEKATLLTYAVNLDVEELDYLTKVLQPRVAKDRSADAVYQIIQDEQQFVNRWNRKMLARIDNVLRDPRRKREYRVLLSQLMLRMNDFDGLISLHEIPLDPTEYGRMHELINDRLTSTAEDE